MYDQNQNRMARPAVMPQMNQMQNQMGKPQYQPQPQMNQMQNQMRPAVMPQMNQMQNQMGGQQYQPQMNQMQNQMPPANRFMPSNQNNPYAAFEGMTPEQLAGMGRIRDASPMDQARLQRIGTAMNSMNGFQGQMQNQLGKPLYQPKQMQQNMGNPQPKVGQMKQPAWASMGQLEQQNMGNPQQQMGQFQQAQYRPQMNQMQNQQQGVADIQGY